MEITNGRNNSIVNVCRFRTKTYRNDLHAFSETLFEKRRIATRNSNATYMCSKVKAELSEDNKILRIEKLK